jgi:hypothetical protein
MLPKSFLLLPCAFFFNQGQYRLGMMALLMQLSLVMWPAAVRLVRSEKQRNGMQRLLAEFSDLHMADPYARTPKTFRRAA